MEWDTARPLSHIRCNADEGYVSIEDALSYLYPDMSTFEITERMNRLPRVCVIYAFWGAAKQKDITPDMTFRACKFDNLHLMLADKPHAMELIDNFKEETDYVILNGQCPLKYPFLLVKDSRKTASQVRFERDCRDRLLKPEYYNKKRERDAAYRNKRKQPDNISGSNSV